MTHHPLSSICVCDCSSLVFHRVTAIIAAKATGIALQNDYLALAMRPTMDELNRQFGIGERLRFERHSSGLVRGVVQTDKCQGSFFLLGGHVAEYWPSSQGQPLLFMSKEAVYEVGKPIRGGVPICFPWFGANKMDSTAPAHGLVRTALWNVLSANETAAGIAVTLGYASPPYRLQLTVVYGERLDLNLTVINESDVDQVCEIALHTFCSLGRLVRQSSRGWSGMSFATSLMAQFMRPRVNDSVY